MTRPKVEIILCRRNAARARKDPKFAAALQGIAEAAVKFVAERPIYPQVPPPLSAHTVRTMMKAAAPASAVLNRRRKRPLHPRQRSVLLAAAEYPDGVTRPQLMTLTGHARSTRNRLLQELTGLGYVRAAGERIFATDEGVAALGDFEPLPKGPALLEHWRARLDEGQRKVLDVVAEAYPRSVPRAAISDATGHARSTRNRLLQELVARRVVVKDGDAIRMSEELASRPETEKKENPMDQPVKQGKAWMIKTSPDTTPATLPELANADREKLLQHEDGFTIACVGGSHVLIVVPRPDGSTWCVQTSLKAFLGAADKLRERWQP